MRPVDLLMDRLAELAAGAEPQNRQWGVCSDISALFFANDIAASAHSVLSHVFRGIGLDPFTPIGYPWGDKWVGRPGQRRRKLCYDVLVQLIAKFGYGGKYDG